MESEPIQISTAASTDFQSPESTKPLLRMGPKDNVGLALRPLVVGECLDELEIVEHIPAGHKVALANITSGSTVLMYDGMSMGIATADIAKGAHVHSHNMRSNLSWDFSSWKKPDFSKWAPVISPKRVTFNGFVRMIGGQRRVGVRNDVWLVPGVTCTARQCEKLAEWARGVIAKDARYSTITGVHVVNHGFGCSEGPKALHNFTIPALLGHVANPNAGAVVCVALGCEENINFPAEIEAAGLSDPKRVKQFNIQGFDESKFATPIEQAKIILQEALDVAAESRREPCHVRELTIGVKCGASGPFSGLTGNRLLGGVADILVANGATVLITEVPEFFGAIQSVLDRAISLEVYERSIQQFLAYRDALMKEGIAVDSNPSPGNIAAGLTTNEQKSAGAVKKGGSGPVVGFENYAARVAPAQGGLVIVFGPGGDTVAITNLQAAGAVIIPWVTQAGTPRGTISPTPKIFATSAGAQKFKSYCDFDAGIVLQEGIEFKQVVEKLYNEILDIAEGKETLNEINDERAVQIWSSVNV